MGENFICLHQAHTSGIWEKLGLQNIIESFAMDEQVQRKFLEAALKRHVHLSTTSKR